MNKKISCEIQKYFLRVIFVKNLLAAALLALPDIFQHCSISIYCSSGYASSL
jgi:hypothetical protein